MMIKNLASMSSLSLLRAFIQFLVSVLIGRYVMPRQYGLISFSLPIIQFIALITDLGLASAIVRQPDLSDRQAGAVFSFSLAIAALSAALLTILATPIEVASGLPGLRSVLIGFAVVAGLSITAGIPRALLERSLRYQEIAAIEGSATIAAFGTCLIGLRTGLGIWSLVSFYLVLQGVRALVFSLRAPGALELNFEWNRAAGLLSFGGWILAANIITFFARNAQNLLIGFALGAAMVGIYGMSYQFMILPLMAIAWPASGVLFATLSKLDDRPQDFGDVVVAVSRSTALIVFPLVTWMMFGLAWPIKALFSPKWAVMFSLLPFLLPIGAIQSLSSYGGVTMLARGRARLQFGMTLFSSLVLVLGFLLSVTAGIRIFSIVYLALAFVTSLSFIIVKLSLIPAHWRGYVRGLGLPTCASLAAAAVAVIIGVHPEGWLRWTGLTLAYCGTIILMYALSWRSISRTIQILLRGAKVTT